MLAPKVNHSLFGGVLIDEMDERRTNWDIRDGERGSANTRFVLQIYFDVLNYYKLINGILKFR